MDHEADQSKSAGLPRPATIKDVARFAGVSIKTVSRVVNREKSVSEAMRRTVEQAIEKLNYRPNISARALAGVKSYLIGLIYDNPSPNYVSELQIGAMRACREAGTHLVIEEVDSSRADLIDHIRDLVGTPGFDGVILPPPLSDNDAAMSALEMLDITFVRIAPDEFPGRAPSVVMDDARAAAEMTAYLWDCGHRDIAFVAAPEEHAAAARRLDGYLLALAERGGIVRPGYIVEGSFTTASGVEAGQKLLALPHRPTAIFASNDEMAAGVMIAAYQQGIELPAALSVVGFDDSPIARSLHPMLTTIRQPTAEMAGAAAKLLIERGLPSTYELDFELIIRGSAVNAPAETVEI